jgi:hypothetical protein
MNRQERRAAKARSRSLKLDPVVAIHEAGHAVGRFVTAGMLGHSNDEAISYIDMSPDGGSDKFWNLPGQPQATTYGPMYSRPMNDLLIANHAQADPSSRASLMLDVAMCKAAGIDVVAWAEAKTVIMMAGPVAEAIYTQRDVASVIESPECENDLNDAIRDCSLAGMSADDRAATINRAIERATTMLTAPNVWRAVNALADNLPSSGRLPGRSAAQIIDRALADIVDAATSEASSPGDVS